ncbi:hypothetical protein, partial [Enterococcus casseliflavus]|uniref:hypothetical protein n=1 Tax=Enterococcus casseliflavus TaxID=37734 RepID=UPI003D100CDE
MNTTKKNLLLALGALVVISLIGCSGEGEGIQNDPNKSFANDRDARRAKKQAQQDAASQSGAQPGTAPTGN